jgi:hypothetical protein
MRRVQTLSTPGSETIALCMGSMQRITLLSLVSVGNTLVSVRVTSVHVQPVQTGCLPDSALTPAPVSTTTRFACDKSCLKFTVAIS